MGRVAAVACSLVVYALFLGVFVDAVLFTEGLVVRRTVDIGPARPLAVALVIDVGWFVLFGVQHSVMARRWFKQRWTRLVPPALERSTFVLVTSLLFVLLLRLWTPLPRPIWHAQAPLCRDALWALSFAGWALCLVATFAIDHYELFGVRQALDALRGRQPAAATFKTPTLYRYIRHPMYTGMLIGFWVAPTMTVGHVLLAAGMTTYLVVGIRFEERDLLRTFGEAYADYKKHVPMLVPLRRGYVPPPPAQATKLAG